MLSGVLESILSLTKDFVNISEGCEIIFSMDFAKPKSNTAATVRESFPKHCPRLSFVSTQNIGKFFSANSRRSFVFKFSAQARLSSSTKS